MKDHSGEDKTYIFRKFFGFDVFSMCHQLKKILSTEAIANYEYEGELTRMFKHTIAWADFYIDWILTTETIEDTIVRFIENPYKHLKDVYDTANDYLKNHLDECIAFNTKESINDAIHECRIREAFSDMDGDDLTLE